MLPPIPSHLSLTHWCLPGASGAEAMVVIEWGRDTPILISSLLQTRTHSLTAVTSTLQHKSWFLSAKNVPRIMSQCSSIAVSVESVLWILLGWLSQHKNILINLVGNLDVQMLIKLLLTRPYLHKCNWVWKLMDWFDRHYLCIKMYKVMLWAIFPLKAKWVSSFFLASLVFTWLAKNKCEEGSAIHHIWCCLLPVCLDHVKSALCTHIVCYFHNFN